MLLFINNLSVGMCIFTRNHKNMPDDQSAALRHQGPGPADYYPFQRVTK